MSKLLGKKQQRQLVTALITVALAGIVWIAQEQGLMPRLEDSARPNTSQPTQTGLIIVEKVVDGDTINVNLNGVSEKVRLIGVDTPETQDPRKPVQCFGKAASDFTQNLIGDNQVKLETDPTNSDRDRYNRLLRYVYLPDNKLVNAEIIKQGYGFAYTSFPFQKIEEFKQLEAQARQQQLGLWGACEQPANQ